MNAFAGQRSAQKASGSPSVQKKQLFPTCSPLRPPPQSSLPKPSRTPPLAAVTTGPSPASSPSSRDESSSINRAARAAGAPSSTDRIGVLLLNLGGPETLADVQPFLYNLFADPDIIRLPAPLRGLQKPLAALISTTRAPKSKEGYESIGGGSPLRRITEEQAQALQRSLSLRGVDAQVYVGMRYWHPFTEEAVGRIKSDGITRLVVLPLYPQFSISTSGSSLRLLETMFKMDPVLSNLRHTVIPSWYQRPGYIQAMSDLIQTELITGAAFARMGAQERESINIFFSAHGVPLSYVTEVGDPYKEEMEECIDLIMTELRRRGVENPYTLAYQSRVGPVDWLKPYTEDAIRELGGNGCRGLLAVPVSFVSEHIETLEEIDIEYREVAEEAGITQWGRVPALNTNSVFIDDLAEAVVEALPYVGTVSASLSQGSTNSIVPMGEVSSLLEAYDREKRTIPPPEGGTFWDFGWTKGAEEVNGRLAMLAVLCILFFELTTGQGVVAEFFNF